MPSFAEVRQKYPQYDDLSDEQLARGLHRKFYADLPFDEFARKVGLRGTTTAADLKAQNPAEYDSASPEYQDRYGLSPAERAGRQIAYGSRRLAEGILSVPDLAGNIVRVPLNAILEAVGSEKRAGPLSDALTEFGAPTPETPTERVMGDLVSGAGAAMGSMGMGSVAAQSANPVVSRVGTTLASNPVLQTVSGATGGTSAGVTREMGGGPLAQFAAGIVGAALPQGMAAATPELTRRAFRGGEAGRQALEQNIDDFATAGTTPTVGQGTQGRVAQGTESLLGRTPGGAGRIIAKATDQADEIGAAVGKQADSLSPGAGADEAGLAIVKGIRGEKATPGSGFVGAFKAQQEKLYSKLDQYLGGQTPVNVSKTRAALQALNADIPGAPALSQWFKNSRIQGIEGALGDDLAKAAVPDSLPYEAIKKLRTLVGNEMADAGLLSDVPRSKWTALYKALSEDLEAAARGAGPDASAAFSRANNYTRAGMRRLEVIDSVIDAAGGPEKVFKAATSGTKEGATVLRSIMQSLPEDGRKAVSAAVLRRLGTAKAGVQNATGDAFSPETFLTNWNTLSQSAKRVLFDRFGNQFRQDLDTIARVTANIRDGAKVFRNPSGTEQAAAQAGTVGGALVALITGRLDVLAGIGATVGGANLSARLMTNPDFVRWLATASKFPAGAYGQQVAQLANIAARTEDADLAEAARLLAEQQEAPEGQQQQRGQQ